MTDLQTLPWHHQHWSMLEAAIDRDHMHHALLIHGVMGLGKQRFVQRLVSMLLCESTAPATQRPCGKCRGCNLRAAGSHPDRLKLAPEENKTQIGIAQVRGLISETTLTSHYGGYRVIVITPADSLTLSAANALLKTLEEPPDRHVFILETERPTHLPVTLRSRCLSLLFSPPDSTQACDWLSSESSLTVDWHFALEWTGGAPLAALEAAQASEFTVIEERLKTIADLLQGRINPVTIAEQWSKTGLTDCLNWQLRLLAQLMRRQVTAPTLELFPTMQEIARRLDLQALNRIYEECMELRDAQMRKLNPNDRLALEGLAVTWQLAIAHASGPN